MDQNNLPRNTEATEQTKLLFVWRKILALIPRMQHRDPSALSEARPGSFVVSSTWRVMPDEFQPGGQKEELWQTLHKGCTLQSIVSPEAGGYRHVLVMVPTPRVSL